MRRGAASQDIDQHCNLANCCLGQHPQQLRNEHMQIGMPTLDHLCCPCFLRRV